MQRWAIVLMLLLVSTARAQTLPSAVDLRAAYCIPIVQEAISEALGIRAIMDTATQSDPEGHWTEKQHLVDIYRATATANLRRLQRYLLPRLPYLDVFGIVGAKQSGDEDIVRMKAHAQACDTQCKLRPVPNTDPYVELRCVIQCQEESPVKPRMNVCDDLRWLPF